MKSFVAALLILVVIWCGIIAFSGILSQKWGETLSYMKALSMDEIAFSGDENKAHALRAEDAWKRNLWMFELAVEQEYVDTVTSGFQDLVAGVDGGDFAHYLAGKACVEEGLSKLMKMNTFSIFQIL